MSDSVTAFIFGVGGGTWVYAQFMKRTNRPQTSLIGAGAVGVACFVVIYTLMRYVFHL